MTKLESHGGITTRATQAGIHVFIPVRTIRISLECHPGNQENDTCIARGKSTAFVEMVSLRLHDEVEEDGTTPIHIAIDTAIDNILENGDYGDGVLVWSGESIKGRK